MFYDVYYDLGCNEGWFFETFDNLGEALQFAQKQLESRIVGYHQCLGLSDNVFILYK